MGSYSKLFDARLILRYLNFPSSDRPSVCTGSVRSFIVFLGARALLVFALCCVVSLKAYSADELSSADISDSKLSREWAEKGWPFLQHYCGDCHEPNEPQGELDIYQFQSVASVGKESASMQRVLEMVRFGAMPPEDAEQPEEVVRKQFSDIADQLLYSVTCDLRPRPGNDGTIPWK